MDWENWQRQKGGNRGYMRDLVAADSIHGEWVRRTYILTKDLAGRLEAVGREHQGGTGSSATNFHVYFAFGEGGHRG